MRHSSFRRRYHPGRRGASRLLRCEPLEHRWLLSITVDTLVDEADGNIDDGDISLRDAIAVAAPGETIDFDGSLDGGTILLTLGELAIRRSMTIDAMALPVGLTIDASGSDPTPDEDNGDGSRIFNIDDGDHWTDSPVMISGLTLTGGDEDVAGGAIRTCEHVTVSDSTVRENWAHGPGGGISASAYIVVTNSTVSGNTAGKGGGGVFSLRGVTVASSTISGNTVTRSSSQYTTLGGGLYALGNVTVVNSTISRNSAYGESYGLGGGIAAGGDVTIANSTILGNSAVANGWLGSGSGGGIHAGGNVSVTNSTISRNSAYGEQYGLGAGIAAGGDVTIANSTISENRGAGRSGGGGGIRAMGDVKVVGSTISGNSAAFGGGIWASGDVAVANSTISGNSAEGGDGGGIFFGWSDATIVIENSLVASNTAAGGCPDLVPGTGPLSVRFSMIGDNRCTGLAEAPVGAPDAHGNLIGDYTGMGVLDPMLGPLADNGGPTQTHSLLAGSPAIDAGDPDFAPPPDFDQRGNPRVADADANGVARIDMGAFEVLRGDLNGDGEVNGLDVDPFVDVLLDGPPSAAADMNADGNVNGLDVDPFVDEVVGGAVPVGTLDSASALDILDVGSMVRQVDRRRPFRSSSHGDDPAHVIHRRSVQYPLPRKSRTGTHIGEDGQRSPPGDLAHDVKHEASVSWHLDVDLAMRDDTNWDRRR